MTDHSPRLLRRSIAVVLALGLALGATSCTSKDKGSSSADQTTTTADPASYFKPPLPANLNAIPYLKGDLAALGNVQLQVTKVKDPGAKKDAPGTRTVVVTAKVTNGSMDDLTLKPETFLAYVSTGDSAKAQDDPEITEPIDSGATRTVQLRFDVLKKAGLAFMVFNGQPYGDRVYNGLISLDPTYKIPTVTD